MPSEASPPTVPDVNQALRRFAKTGDAGSIRPLIVRDGPLVLGLLTSGSDAVPPDAFADVWAHAAHRGPRGSTAKWQIALLAEAASRLGGQHVGRSGLWLASHAGLTMTALAAVFRTPRETLVDAIENEALALAGIAPGAAHVGLHLSDKTVAGLCCGTLGPHSLPLAAAHVAWCPSCRTRASEIGAKLSEFASTPLPELDGQQIDATVVGAQQFRLRHRLLPRFMRFLGLSTGARLRPVRLAVLALVVLAGAATLAVGIRADRMEARHVHSALRLRAVPHFIAGASTAVGVAILDGEARESANGDGVKVEVQLRNAAHKVLAKGVATTTHGGTAEVKLKLPMQNDATADATLHAEATVAGELRSLDLPVQIERKIRQHLSSDKPTYQPGQTIHLRGLSLDLGSGKPLADRPALLELRDPRGNRLTRLPVTVSAMGITSGDVELSQNAAFGTYTARLEVDGMASTASLKVERYTLPPFSVAVHPSVGATDGKAPFDVEISANFTTGVALGSGKARLTVDAGGSMIFSQNQPISGGKAKFSVQLPDYLIQGRRSVASTISLHAVVRDPAGRAEEGRGGLVLAGDEMAITLVSEAPSIRRNLPRANRILVRAVRPDGKPVETDVTLFAPGDGARETVGSGEQLGKARTGADGLAAMDLPPAYFGRPLAVLAVDPLDKKQYWTSTDAPPMREGNLVLRCDKSLLRAGERLTCQVFVPSRTPALLRAEIDGRVVALASTAGKQGIFDVVLAVPDDATGLLRLSLDGAPEEDTVLALAAPRDGLRVELTGLDPTRPGDEATLRMRVTDSAGKPKASAVGIAVVDAAVFARVAGTPPPQVIEALFAMPDLAVGTMALLFPDEPPGAEGGQGKWTAAQQATARWLLAQQKVPIAHETTGLTLEDDRRKLADQNADARELAGKVRTVGWIVFGLALALALLVGIFWLRIGVAAASAALALGWLASILLQDFLKMRETTSGPVVLLLAIGIFAGLLFWVHRQRQAEQTGEATSHPGQRRALRVVLVAGPLMLAGAAYLSSHVFRPSSGRFLDRDVSTDESHAMFEVQLEEKDAPSARRENAEKAASARPSVDAEEANRNARDSVVKNTVAGSLVGANGAATKLFANDGGDGEGTVTAKFGGLQLDDSKGGGTMEKVKGGGGQAEAPVAVRKDFPETLYFNPAAVAGEDGIAQVQFRIADSITTWQAQALASDAGGLLGAGSGDLVVSKDFHVDLDVPHDLTTGDQVSVQIAAQNERPTAATATLTATTDAGLEIDASQLAEPVRVAARGISGMQLPVTALKSGQHFVSFAGEMHGQKDALKRVIEISPDGREVLHVDAGLVVDTVQRPFNVPDDALPDGRSVVLTLLGSPLAQALDGLEQMTDRPHGTFEQEASTAYVNALVLKALRATGGLTPERDAAMLRILRLAYQDLLAYEAPGGGFSDFGGPDGASQTKSYLTAYGLMVLSQLASLVYVDEEVLDRTRAALSTRQDEHGAFGPPAESAYVALGFLAADPQCAAGIDAKSPGSVNVQKARTACAKVVGVLEAAFVVTEGVDSYVLALAADALVNGGPSHRARAEALLDELDRRAAVVGTGRDRRVTFLPRSGSLYGGYGDAGEAETTALVAHALATHGGRPDKAREAMRSLLVLRDPSGGFYSTQGTALALRAMLAAAAAGQDGGKAVVTVDGAEVATVSLDAKSAASPVRLDLTEKVHAGSKLTISLGGSDAAADVGYRVASKYYVPWNRPLAPQVQVADGQEPTLTIEQRLDATTYGLGDRASLGVHISRGGEGMERGVILAQIGLPPGFRPEDNVYDGLLDSRVHRVEPYARGLAIYMDDPGPGGEVRVHIPLVAARAVRKVLVPRSAVYFYYQPQVSAQAPPIPVMVKARLGKRTGGRANSRNFGRDDGF